MRLDDLTDATWHRVCN